MRFFLKKQNGVITIMISLILVAIMSSSSLLMEIARYRNHQALLEEIVDSASFSMLSNYDSDLLKRFGLLAMSDKVTKDEYLKYLKTNVNGDIEDPNAVEQMFDILEDDTSLEGIYALNDVNVLRRQILEFSKYRVPVSFVENVADLDKLIKSLKKKLNEMIPFLNVFQAVAGCFEKMLKTFKAGVEYENSTKDMETKANEYDETYDALEKKLKEKLKYVKENKPVEPTEPEAPKEMEKEMPETLEEFLELLGFDKLEDYIDLKDDIKEPKLEDFVSDANGTAEEKYQKAIQLYNEEYDGKSTGGYKWDDYKKDKKKYNKEKEDYKEEYKKYEKKVEKYEKDLEEYKNTIKNYNKELENCKSEFLTAIKNYKEAIGTYQEKFEAFQSSYDSLATAAVDMAIEEQKANYKQSLEEQQQSADQDGNRMSDQEKNEKIEDFEKKADNLSKSTKEFDGLLNTALNACNELTSTSLENKQQKLSEYYVEIEGVAIIELNSNEELPKKCNINLTGVMIGNMLSNFLKPFAAVEALISQICDSLKSLGTIMHFISECSNASGLFDSRYAVKIDEAYFQSLPSKVSASETSSEHDSEDKNDVTAMLNDSQRIADSIGYDISNLYPANRESNVNTKLQNDIENLKTDMADISELAENSIWKIGNIIKLFHAFGSFISHLITFYKDLILDLANTIYNSLLITEYATTMFSNRTVTNADKNLKGDTYSSFQRYYGRKSTMSRQLLLSKFKFFQMFMPIGSLFLYNLVDKNTDTSFAKAEQEYIFAGTSSEMTNQGIVYSILFFIRYLLNLPSCLGNETVKVSLDIPVVGIVVFLLWVAAETMVDMQILTVFKKGVPIIKLPKQVYLSASGVDDLVKKFKEGFGSLYNLIGEDDMKEESKKFQNALKDFQSDFDDEFKKGEMEEESGKEEEKSWFQDYKEDLLKNLQEFTYTEHMNILLLFIPEKTKLLRMQDLIQMEMNHKKFMDGKVDQYKLEEAYTYLRLYTKAHYKPILPMPDIPGANNEYLTIDKVYYAGY